MRPPSNSRHQHNGGKKHSSGTVPMNSASTPKPAPQTAIQPANSGRSGATVRRKRRESYWDPLFNPSFKGTNDRFDWNTKNVTGVQYSLCEAESLIDIMSSKLTSRWSMKNFKFSNCDFQGNFTTMDLSFTGCEFINTDLGYSNWKNIKFSRCKFIRTSLTLATFEQCQFIDCSWEEIGISGTETKLFDTTISNPWDFVLSAYTNTDKDVLKQHGNTNPAHQIMRLEETKVKLSRAILSSSERNSDDLVYYEAVKTYLTQSLHSRRVRAAYDRDTTKSTATKLKSIWIIALLDTESTILKLSGSINAWGYSLARPALVGFALICIFALIYFLTGISSTAKLAAMTSFDVTLLVGYTKHASEQSTWPAQIVYGVNALLGLWWYAIFVPTVINRISRVR